MLQPVEATSYVEKFMYDTKQFAAWLPTQAAILLPMQAAILCITVGQWATMLPSSNLGRMGETILCFDALLAPSTHLCLVPFNSKWIILTSFHDGMDWCSTLEQHTVTSTATKCLDETLQDTCIHKECIYLHTQGVYLTFTRYTQPEGCMVILIKMSYPYSSRM
jgi:hypothetical protein